jgi:hypothetical protein
VATNFANPRSHEAREGRMVAPDPGSRACFDLDLEFHSGAGDVSAAADAIAALQAGIAPLVSPDPQPGCCVPG